MGMSSARRSNWFLWKATKLPWKTRSSTDNLFSRTFRKSSSGFSDLNKAESTSYEPVTTMLIRQSVSSSRTSLVVGYFSPSENVVRAVFSILVKRGLPT